MIIIDNLMSQPKPSGDSQVSIPDFDINLKVSPDVPRIQQVCEILRYEYIVDWIIYVLEYAGDNKELLLKRLQEEKDKRNNYSLPSLPLKYSSVFLIVLGNLPLCRDRNKWPRKERPARKTQASRYLT